MSKRLSPFSTEPIWFVDFFGPGYVVCPVCAGRAEVWYPRARVCDADTSKIDYGADSRTIRLICASCTHRQDRPTNTWCHQPDFGARDPFFWRPLWAQQQGRYGLVWAINTMHLNALRRHIRAPHLSRRPRVSNQDWRSRTPAWMSSRKNRQQVDKILNRLERKLA